jgi:phospholipid transport system transporter-binding protein
LIVYAGNTLQMSGDVTMSSVSALFATGINLQPNAEVLVDLAGLQRVDSSAVSLMLAWVREAQRKQVVLRFTNVPENLRSLANLYGVAELLSLNPVV